MKCWTRVHWKILNFNPKRKENQSLKAFKCYRKNPEQSDIFLNPSKINATSSISSFSLCKLMSKLNSQSTSSWHLSSVFAWSVWIQIAFLLIVRGLKMLFVAFYATAIPLSHYFVPASILAPSIWRFTQPRTKFASETVTSILTKIYFSRYWLYTDHWLSVLITYISKSEKYGISKC